MVDFHGESERSISKLSQLGSAEPKSAQMHDLSKSQRVWPESFQYKELEPQNDTIRVVKVEHSDIRNPLECTLRHVSSSELLRLPDGERCTALSYEWYLGTERKATNCNLKEMLLNERTFKVNMNLYNFLKAWRLLSSHAEKKDKWLWIDAISLDQRNDFEKNHQVQRMKTTFGEADEVVAWLGYGSHRTETALQMIHNSGTGWENAMDPRGRISYFKIIASLSYWKRLWIVQELAIAKKACLMYGRTQVDWETFGTRLAEECAVPGIEADEAIRITLEVGHWLSYDSARKDHVREKELPDLSADFVSDKSIKVGLRREVFMIYGYWILHRYRHPPSLTDLLFSFEKSKCERWQDRIYGLLGLARGGESFQVDYNESRRSLHKRVIRAFGAFEDASEQYSGYGENSNQYLKIILNRITGSYRLDDSTDEIRDASCLPKSTPAKQVESDHGLLGLYDGRDVMSASSRSLKLRIQKSSPGTSAPPSSPTIQPVEPAKKQPRSLRNLTSYTTEPKRS